MHIHKTVVLLALASILVWGTAAQDEPVKIGVVDVDQAFNSTVEGKAAREELSRKQREAEATVQPLIEELRQKDEELKVKRFVLSDEALFQRQLDLQELRGTLELRVKELQRKLEVDQTRLNGPLQKKLLEIINEAGKGSGVAVIFGRSAPGVLYTREALDITDLVIEKYNQKS